MVTMEIHVGIVVLTMTTIKVNASSIMRSVMNLSPVYECPRHLCGGREVINTKTYRKVWVGWGIQMKAFTC